VKRIAGRSGVARPLFEYMPFSGRLFREIALTIGVRALPQSVNPKRYCDRCPRQERSITIHDHHSIGAIASNTIVK